MGRWCSTDPIGLGGGINRYAYCRGSPVTLRDTDRMVPTLADDLAVTRAELSSQLGAGGGTSAQQQGLALVAADLLEEQSRAVRDAATAGSRGSGTQNEDLNVDLRPDLTRPANIPDHQGDVIVGYEQRAPVFASWKPGTGGDILEYYDDRGRFLGEAPQGLARPILVLTISFRSGDGARRLLGVVPGSRMTLLGCGYVVRAVGDGPHDRLERPFRSKFYLLSNPLALTWSARAALSLERVQRDR